MFLYSVRISENNVEIRVHFYSNLVDTFIRASLVEQGESTNFYFMDEEGGWLAS